MEDGLQNPLRLFQVSGHTFRNDQCTIYISGLYQQVPGRKTRRLRNSVSRWHPHLHWKRGQRARPSRSIGVRPTVEALIVRQPQEVLLPPRWGEIPRLYRLLSRHPNRRGADQDRTWFAWTLVSTWYTGLFRICQLLSMIHPGIQ